MEANGFRSKSADGLESPKLEHQVDDEDSESNPLLPPKKDEMSRKTDRKRLKVQWNDRHGNQLAQVLEFVPRCLKLCFFLLVSSAYDSIFLW